jgi:Fe-S-cluster containining protein
VSVRRTETGRVHLDLLGQTHVLEVPVVVGATSLGDLIPVARELAEQVGAIVTRSAATRGEHPSCAPECTACCRHLVPISVIEAVALARHVDALPGAPRARVRARFATALGRLRAAGLYDPAVSRHALLGSSWDEVSRRYFELRLDCPLLHDGLCSLYEHRPMTCRQYAVTTPAAWCERLDERVVALERPVRMSEALADAAIDLAGVAVGSIPLVLALEWAAEHADALGGPVDGEHAFSVLMEAAQRSNDE